ncbi:MAG: hypothetical protein HYT16_00865 [DPANN group archaeon]|nr:hypothetical protein [DPANN group archaeon]
MPLLQSVRFHFRAMSKEGLDLLVQGEGNPDEIENKLAPATDENGFVRQDCRVIVWYQPNTGHHEFLAISIKGPGSKEYYCPSKEIVFDLIRARQSSANLNYVVQITPGWLGEGAIKTKAGLNVIRI